jgi:hypothetical protein
MKEIVPGRDDIVIDNVVTDRRLALVDTQAVSNDSCECMRIDAGHWRSVVDCCE